MLAERNATVSGKINQKPVLVFCDAPVIVKIGWIRRRMFVAVGHFYG
jgi:hypothetical protein